VTVILSMGDDALAVLTDWPEFRHVPLAEVKGLMRGDVVFDGRNLLRRADAAQAGLKYVGVGRPATEPG
jgi:UDPglucose 6-dehydrogenase